MGVLCIGAAVVDRKYRSVRPVERDTSNPVTAERSAGGVARNVAENLARLDIRTAFASLVGDDENGRWLVAGLQRLGIETGGVRCLPGRESAEYVAVLEPDGSLALGLADMAIFDAFAPAFLDEIAPLLAGASWVFADCNLPAEMLQSLVARRRAGSFQLAVDAVSLAKVMRLPIDLGGIDLLFLNEAEAAALLGTPLPAADAARRLRERGANAVIVTQGSRGVAAAHEEGTTFVPGRPAAVVDVTGAGDALIAGTLVGLIAGRPLPEAARTGIVASALTIESRASVRPDLSPALLARAMEAV